MAVTNRQLMAMKKAGMTDAEIQQVLLDDKAVDRGQIMEWDLPPEEHKKAMKYANSDEKKKKTAEKGEKKGKTAYNLDATGKKKKENPTKASIIAEIAKFLTEMSENACENVTITNKERQIAFRIGENDYEFTLVQKRKPKN